MLTLTVLTWAAAHDYRIPCLPVESACLCFTRFLGGADA